MTKEERRQVIQLGKQGMTLREISEATGIKLKAIRNYVYHNNYEYQRIYTKTRHPERNPITRARVACNLTREQVEDAIGVSVATIYAWEHRGFCKAVKNVVRVARLYGVSVEELVGDLDE